MFTDSEENSIGMARDMRRSADRQTPREVLPHSASNSNSESSPFYCYVRNDPVNLVDPTGLCAITGSGAASKPSYRQQQMGWLQSSITDLQSRQAFDLSQGGAGSSYFSDQIAVRQNSYDIFDLEERKNYARSQGDAASEAWLYERLGAAKAQKADRIKTAGYISYSQMAGAYASGAATGAQGGGSIVANTFSFGATDYFGATNSEQYNGADYTGSRVLATISREAFMTAGTLGVSQVARGGIAGTTWSANLVNAAASSPTLYNRARAVSTGLAVYDAASGGYHIGNGAVRVYDGDNWGFAEAAGGGLSFLGSVASARELGQLPSGGAYRDVPAMGGQVHHTPANGISPLSRGDGPSFRMETADHMSTASWGANGAAYRSQQRALIEAGDFRSAVQMGIADATSQFGSRYAQGIQEMSNYVNRFQKTSAWKLVPAQ